MRAIKAVGVCLVVAIALTALLAAGAQARMSKLVLKSSGSAVAAGSPAGGSLQFGPCGSFVSTGTLKDNERMLDSAEFTSFEGNPGGCGEGGPSVSGKLTSIEVSASGQFTALGHLSYDTELPARCEYALTKLTGKFALPGPTTALLSGVGKRVKAHSAKGCKGTLHVSHAEAELYDAQTSAPYEAERT